MDPKTTDAIKKMTLAARELFMKEVSEQLEGIYGFLPDGKLMSVSDYPVLSEISEAGETRRLLEAWLDNETQAGTSPEKAREKLVREAAFTWLNRFVAFKMMEARKLIRPAISRGAESSGFVMWLTEPGNEAHLEDYEKGDLCQNGRGEGPRQGAYRHFILAQCARLAEEVRVLFDPDSLASRFFPRPTALKGLIDLLNAEELKEAWKPGNEETIGWVYQHYVSIEKDAIFKKLYKDKQKIKAEEVPFATQIFTPRWIVRFLVENTLGRLWLQMHPDSRLRDKLEYLVPLPEENLPKLPLKPVKEITLMDPACGTMHFGLVAFDLFYAMYQEEIERAGDPGWPVASSIMSEENIPAMVLTHNLYGIDLDQRPLQLAALALYLKAKAYNKNVKIEGINLTCADLLWLNGKRLRSFTERVFNRPVYRRILESIWLELQKAPVVGSLLRIEEKLVEVVQKEKKEGKGALPFEGFLEGDVDDGYWVLLEEQIVQAFDHLVREAGEGNPDTFLGGEAIKGLKLLHFLRKSYDVVVTNPPYLYRRNMEKVLADFLEHQYPDAKGDLYAAFIARDAELLAEGGRLGMITQQSFMFVSTYEKFRKGLLQKHVLETMCHVGPRAFEELQGEKANTTAFVLRREPDPDLRDNSVGVYFRLVKEKDGEAKRQAFERAIEELKERAKNTYSLKE